MKYLSIDIETTEIDYKYCDLLEFGAVLEDTTKIIDLNLLPKFHCYFLPPNGLSYTGQPIALSMHPFIFKRIAERDPNYTYLHVNSFGNKFKQFLVNNEFQIEQDRVIINVAGKNVSFDIRFLEEKTDINKHVKIRHRVIDPSMFYMNGFDEVVPGTSECKKRAGLDENVAHNAIDDALDVIALLRIKFYPYLKII